MAGEFEGSLNNAGEVIRLLDRQGVVIHEVATLDDAPPWPAEADGAGYSLELISPEGAIGRRRPGESVSAEVRPGRAIRPGPSSNRGDAP